MRVAFLLAVLIAFLLAVLVAFLRCPFVVGMVCWLSWLSFWLSHACGLLSLSGFLALAVGLFTARALRGMVLLGCLGLLWIALALWHQNWGVGVIG
jgi:hypothetical protein